MCSEKTAVLLWSTALSAYYVLVMLLHFSVSYCRRLIENVHTPAVFSISTIWCRTQDERKGGVSWDASRSRYPRRQHAILEQVSAALHGAVQYMPNPIVSARSTCFRMQKGGCKE